jgi:GT2 family glycosyltransferase/Flp pilus assembly protein TadD
MSLFEKRPPRFTASIIIPVFNKVELTVQCLTARAEATRDVSYEVIVVDNASSDETPTFLAGLAGDVVVLRNEVNLGFARACNQGARAAQGRYLVFLNNDTIPLAGWLSALVEEAEQHPEVVMVGSKLLYEDGTLQHAGVVFARETRQPYHPYRMMPADTPGANHRRELQAVTAACVLIPTHVFHDAGCFDEGFRNGWEDLDFCLRLRSRGGVIVYQPRSVLFHLESQTPGRMARDGANRKRFFEKWKGHLLADEDAFFFEDGCAMNYSLLKGRRVGRLMRLCSAEDRARWRVVAEVQTCAATGDREGVRARLARFHEWPREASVLRWAGIACAWAEVPEQSERYWAESLALEESSELRAVLARNLLERGDLERAEEQIEALLGHNPTSPDGFMLKGTLAMQRGRYEEAATAFESALLNGAVPRNALVGQGMAAALMGAPELCWDLMSAVLTDDPGDALALHWLLTAGSSLGRWEELTEHLQGFLACHPEEPSARFALVGVYLRRGCEDEARAEYATLREQHPTYEGLSDLAQALERLPAQEPPPSPQQALP